jgi:hypothetical protein
MSIVPKIFKLMILTGGHFGFDLPGIVFLRRQVVEAVRRGQPGLWPTLGTQEAHDPFFINLICYIADNMLEKKENLIVN